MRPSGMRRPPARSQVLPGRGETRRGRGMLEYAWRAVIASWRGLASASLPDMARGARLGQAARMEGGPTHGCSEMVAREAEGTAGRGRYASCLIRQSASICQQRRPPFRLEKRSGAAAAWWSHNPQVGGSTPPSATLRRAREPAGPHARLTSHLQPPRGE